MKEITQEEYELYEEFKKGAWYGSLPLSYHKNPKEVLQCFSEKARAMHDVYAKVSNLEMEVDVLRARIENYKHELRRLNVNLDQTI